jgi:hypothetical protein
VLQKATTTKDVNDFGFCFVRSPANSLKVAFLKIPLLFILGALKMSTSVPSKKGKTRKERMDEAFATATRGLEADIPLLLHGSLGGSLHSSSSNIDEQKFDPELTAKAARDTHHLIAALTAQYIHRLVDAALDVRDMQLFGDSTHYNNLRHRLPPPPLESLYQPRTSQKMADVESKSNQLKRSAALVSSWDNPLPKPKIRGRSESSAGVTRDEQVQKALSNDVPAEEWIGAIGLDMWQNCRARAIYTQHRSITAQHFVFPLCHDSYVYGRIREVQASKVNVIEPILHDTTVWDAIRTEGQLQREEILRSRRRINRKKKKQKVEPKRATPHSDDDSDEDVEESALNEEETPTWPGLDRLLPANRF